MTDTLIKIEHVSKKFCRSLKKSLWYGVQDLGRELVGRSHGGNGGLRPDEFWAVRDVSFELKRGECLGLIGRNGAGKTSLLRMLNGLIKPDGGRIEMRGRVGAMIALGAGFNPVLTGRENVYVGAAVYGLEKREIDARFEEIVEFAELSEFIDSPVQTYSSGMAVRLGFAIASALSPDILLLDEVLAVGDANFRQKCFARISDLMRNAAVILVSHDHYALQRICSRGLLLERGIQKAEGAIADVLEQYVPAGDQAGRRPEALTAGRGLDLRWSNPGQERSIDIRYGEPLALLLTYSAERPLRGCLVVVTVSFAGAHLFQSHAEVDIQAGAGRISLHVDSVRLSEGSYDVSLTIMEDAGRLTVLAWMNLMSINVRGKQGYGILNQASLMVAVEQ